MAYKSKQQKYKRISEYRRAKVKNGICCYCLKPVSPRSRSLCEYHLLKTRMRINECRRTKKENGICRHCTKPICQRSKELCEDHRLKRRKTQMEYARTKKENGICCACTKPICSRSTTLCEYHLLKRRMLNKKRGEQRRRKEGIPAKFPNGRPEFKGSIQTLITPGEYQWILQAKKALKEAKAVLKSQRLGA